MLATALKIEKADGCGAIVRDIDLASLTDAEAGALRQALFDNGVLFFRGQSLTPEQHIALAELFAPIDVNRYFPADAAYPMIAKVEKTEAQVVNIGGGWHTDHSYDRRTGDGLDPGGPQAAAERRRHPVRRHVRRLRHPGAGTAG